MSGNNRLCFQWAGCNEKKKHTEVTRREHRIKGCVCSTKMGET